MMSSAFYLAFEGKGSCQSIFKESIQSRIRVGQKHMKMNQTGNFSRLYDFHKERAR